MEKITIYITGMACGGCSATIANALRAIDGVIEADVSHTEGTAEVSFDPARVQIGQLKAAIEAAGYAIAS
jgi:copper chaperone CopZ